MAAPRARVRWRGRRPGRGAVGRWTACLLAVAACAAVACRKTPAPPRWSWQPGGLSEVLAAARAQGMSALVLVDASWCPTCHQLERDVFERNAGRVPADRIVGVRIDFDTPAGQEVAASYRVMGLPTSLVLDASGKELGRIEGFETADGWLAALDGALAGKDESTAVLARFAKSPDDPALAAEAGAVRLAHGEEEEGIRLLEQVRSTRGDAARKPGIDATRTLGRWFFRVRHDDERALAFFQDGAARAAGDDAAWGFHYWTAMTLRELRRPDEALALLDRLATEHVGLAEPIALKAEYLYMVGGDDAHALELARKAAELKPTDDWNHYLVGVLAERTGDREGALAAARRAVELAPDEAIYAHLLERLEKLPAP